MKWSKEGKGCCSARLEFLLVSVPAAAGIIVTLCHSEGFMEDVVLIVQYVHAVSGGGDALEVDRCTYRSPNNRACTWCNILWEIRKRESDDAEK